MKKIGYILGALAGMTLTAGAQTLPKEGAAPLQAVVDGVTVSNWHTAHNGTYMDVEMALDLSALHVDNNRAVILTPRLIHGTNSLDLPAVGIYGRRRYYFYVRNDGNMLAGGDAHTFRASQKPDSLRYHKMIPYEQWMDGSALTLHRTDWGCCYTLLAQEQGVLGHYREAFFPELVYVRPKAETQKSRALQGSAYIDFPVNRTEIRTDYRNNAAELGRIQAGIDSVRHDPDVTITAVWLKGYASPESPYLHNKELAIGRTEALKRHIGQLYHFREEILQTDYEPEDWEGLRNYVERSNLTNREGILSLIDTPMDPDQKEARIKQAYPDDYNFLLQHCYPALRHTDYRIAYVIRTYTDLEEIRKVMRTEPAKLSLNEFYLVAQEEEPGTEAFTEVFETAVRLYPADETANLNAANAAMRHGDNERAARYLERAGQSPEAIYARGALAIRRQAYDTARGYLQEASRLGLPQAAETLAEMEQGLR